MGDFCDLYKNIYQNFKQEEFNNIHEPLPVEERNSKILYASDSLRLEYDLESAGFEQSSQFCTFRDSADRGRKLVAKCLIPKHKTIINEYPTVLQVKPLCTCASGELSPVYRCHNCGMAVKIFFR